MEDLTGIQVAMADQATLSKVNKRGKALRIDGKARSGALFALGLHRCVTNQIIHTIYLKHLDAPKLGEILQQIEQKDGVSIMGVARITKMSL